MTCTQVVIFQVSSFLAIFLTFRSSDRSEGELYRLCCEVTASVAWSTTFLCVVGVMANKGI